MTTGEFHPLANLFPLLEGEAFNDLVADVAEHGIREPVWLHEGKILDGRNRWRAAQQAGIECPSREYTGDAAAAFVVSLNLHRRHLNESQRAIVAARLANLPAHRPTANTANLQTSVADAAAMLNVSPRTVGTAKRVVEGGAPELVAAVERGEVAVSVAAVVTSLTRSEQTVLVARGPDEVRAAAKTVHVVTRAAGSTEVAEKATSASRVEILAAVNRMLLEALAVEWRQADLSDATAFHRVQSKQRSLIDAASYTLSKLKRKVSRDIMQVMHAEQKKRRRAESDAARVQR